VLAATTSVSNKQIIGEDLTKTFVEFVSFNLKHMAREEEVINSLLWRYCTDAELLHITQQIRSNTTPAEMEA